MRKQELQLKLALPTPIVSEHNRRDLRWELKRVGLFSWPTRALVQTTQWGEIDELKERQGPNKSRSGEQSLEISEF